MSTLAGEWLEMNATAVVAAEHASADPSNVWLRIEPTDEERYFAFCGKEDLSGSLPAQRYSDINFDEDSDRDVDADTDPEIRTRASSTAAGRCSCGREDTLRM